MSEPKFLFIAKNSQQFKLYADRLEIPQQYRVYISRLEQLYGYHNLHCYFVGEWYDLPDAAAMRSYAEAHNLQVEYIES